MTIQVRFRPARMQVYEQTVQYTTDATDFLAAVGEALFAFGRQFPVAARWGEVTNVQRIDRRSPPRLSPTRRG